MVMMLLVLVSLWAVGQSRNRAVRDLAEATERTSPTTGVRFDTYNVGYGEQGPTWVKDCRLCHTRPVEEFSKDSSKKDGYRNVCKPCDNSNSRDRYHLSKYGNNNQQRKEY